MKHMLPWLSAMLLWCSAEFVQGGELPEKLAKEVEEATEKRRKADEENDKKMLALFDKAVLLLNKEPISGDERARMTLILMQEKKAFQRDGTVPFSVMMRATTMQYLQNRRNNERPVHVAYEAVFKHCVKTKDTALSAESLEKKTKLLAPRDVASWQCDGGKWGFVLRSDGSSGAKSNWKLLKDRIVFNNHDAPHAPPGGYVDNCILSADGQTFQSYGTPGGKFPGKLMPLK